MSSHLSGPVPAVSPQTPSFGTGTGAGAGTGTGRGAGVVRQAGVDDAALLHGVAAATFALACPPHTTAAAIEQFITTALSKERFGDYLADPDRVLFVAERGREAIGYAMLVFGEPSDPDAGAAVRVRPTAELNKIYVLEIEHGGGTAAALLNSVIDVATRRGASSLWLGVNQENQRANRFYEKHGFAKVGTKTFLVGDRYEDDFVRERRLDSAARGR